MGSFGKKTEMLITYLSNNSNNENYGDDIYKYIYRITGRFDRDCSSLVAMRIRSKLMLPKIFRYYQLSNLLEIVDNGDTRAYTPELLKLTSNDISDIKVAIEFIEPIFETDKSEGARLLKPIYEKYQDFRFDTQMKLFLKSKGIDVLELQEEVEILDRLFTLWNREAIPYLKTIEPIISAKLVKIQDAASKLSRVAKAGLQCKEPTPSSPVIPQVIPPNQQLNVYFDCNNFDYLRIVLNREVRGNGGRQLAVVLFALAEIGYKVKSRKLKPLFETILKPQYGAVGSLQAVTKYDCKAYDFDFTKEVDTLAAKFREEL